MEYISPRQLFTFLFYVYRDGASFGFVFCFVVRQRRKGM